MQLRHGSGKTAVLVERIINKVINEKVDIDKADVAFASGIKGLNETNKMIIKNTIEALLAKQEKDKEDKK